MKTMAYSEFRADCAAALDSVTDGREELVITRAGREPVVMTAPSEYKALQETAHLLRGPESARRFPFRPPTPAGTAPLVGKTRAAEATARSGERGGTAHPCSDLPGARVAAVAAGRAADAPHGRVGAAGPQMRVVVEEGVPGVAGGLQVPGPVLHLGELGGGDRPGAPLGGGPAAVGGAHRLHCAVQVTQVGTQMRLLVGEAGVVVGPEGLHLRGGRLQVPLRLAERVER
ncbi:type II toxin-antitoxin system Phd/YefM family antitoxin [Nocardiopsis sp. CNT-189]